MGLPLTWITLNLMHLFWVDTAHIMCGEPVYRSLKTTRICGDDLLGHWPEKICRTYEKLVLDCGGKLSEGKHFKSKKAFVFTEIIGRINFSNVEKKDV